MENVIFYGRKSEKSKKNQTVDYYMIEENIGEPYMGMYRYGIRIVAEQIFDGGGKTIDMKQLNNVFYRYNDADEFMHELMERKAMPNELCTYVDKYIIQNCTAMRRSVV